MTGSMSEAIDDAGRTAAWVFAREASANLARATVEWMQQANWDEAGRLARVHVNQAAEHQTGHGFEFVETLKFNANAAKAGDVIRAVTTASQGKPGAAADIIISRGDEVLREVQAKVYSDPAQRLYALSADKYHDMQRLVPSDHVDGVRESLGKALGRSPDNIRTSRYIDVDKHLAGDLHHDGLSSGGTTANETYDAGRDPVGWLRGQAAHAMVNETLKSAAVGAAGGAVFGAAAHSLQLAITARNTDVGISEAIVEVTAAATKAGVRSGVTSGLATVIEIGARNTEIFSTLAKTTAPIAISNTVLVVGEAAYQYATGAITREQLVDRCAGAALRNTGAWAFGVVGQTIVPIPVVGAIVGSTAGYVTSAIIIEGFKLARVAAAEADAAEDRLLELEAQAVAAVMSMEEYRLTLEILIDQEAEDYRDVLVPLMDKLEEDLTGGDDSAMEDLVALNLQLGYKLEWSSLPQFDDFMFDPLRILEL